MTMTMPSSLESVLAASLQINMQDAPQSYSTRARSLLKLVSTFKLHDVHGQVLDTLAEIQERHEAVRELEKSLLDLHQIFLDMAVLVEAQGEQLDNIEAQVGAAQPFFPVQPSRTGA